MRSVMPNAVTACNKIDCKYICASEKRARSPARRHSRPSNMSWCPSGGGRPAVSFHSSNFYSAGPSSDGRYRLKCIYTKIITESAAVRVEMERNRGCHGRRTAARRAGLRLRAAAVCYCSHSTNNKHDISFAFDSR